jgi:hypothetical protein
MLYTLRPTPGATSTEISGKKLAKWLRHGKLGPEDRGQLALRLQTGMVRLGKLTARQARWLTGATVRDLAAVRRAQRPGNNGRVLYRRDPSDVEVDRVVAAIGADKILRSLDRMTAPAGTAE